MHFLVLIGQRLRVLLARCLQGTLFGRLALLLAVAVIASHVLALTLMFELRPPAQHLPPPPPGTAPPGAGAPPPPLHAGLLLDIGVRLAVAAVSHDLRTPLTRLRLRTETLPDAKDRAEFTRDIVEMDDMIRATLDHLRGVADAEPVLPVDLRVLLLSLADDYVDGGHSVRVHGQAAPLPGQVGALRRCVDNLVGNAVRYGGGAEITLSGDAKGMRITVRDHGPGLPAQELDHVFKPFYRAEVSCNRVHGGTGLGLSIARDIAERHRGSLHLCNAEGGGLIATLELPRPARESV